MGQPDVIESKLTRSVPENGRLPDSFGVEVDINSIPDKEGKECVIKLNDSQLIRRGEILSLTASPGSGKTACIEALASAFIANKHNLSIDTLGWSYSTSGRNCLIVDTERPSVDCGESYERIINRLGKDTALLNGDRLTDLTYLRFLEIPKLHDRKVALEYHIKTNEYELIIIDGLLDFSNSLNDEGGTSECVTWLRSLASKYDCAICTTLHPNKGREGREIMAGHLGGFLYRYCRTSLLIKPNQYDKSVKEITVDFLMGKLSHSDISQFEPSYFAWDKRLEYMTGTTEPEHIKTISFDETLIKELMNSFIIIGKTDVPSSELKEKYAERKGIKYETAKKHILEAVKNGVIESNGNGKSTTYRIKDYVPF